MKAHSVLAPEVVEEPHWCNVHMWVSKTTGQDHSVQYSVKTWNFILSQAVHDQAASVLQYRSHQNKKNP